MAVQPVAEQVISELVFSEPGISDQALSKQAISKQVINEQRFALCRRGSSGFLVIEGPDDHLASVVDHRRAWEFPLPGERQPGGAHDRPAHRLPDRGGEPALKAEVKSSQRSADKQKNRPYGPAGGVCARPVPLPLRP